MLKRYCDICGEHLQIIPALDHRDYETHFYKLVRVHIDGENDYEVDICNDCLRTVIQLANGELCIVEEQSDE